MAQVSKEPGAPDSVRERALYRLMVAGAVTAAALLALWWLDRSEVEDKQARPAPPAPIVTAPTGTAPPEPMTPPPEEAPPEKAAAPRVVAPAEAPPLPPPPEVAAVPAAPRPAAVDRETAVSPARNGESRAAAVPFPPIAAGGDYLVQLGVFGNPDHALQLVRQLQGKGIRAQTETRVQVGPFATREDAEKAREALARLGYRPVIAVQDAK